MIKNGNKVSIENIDGTKDHLSKIRAIKYNVGRNCRKLHLQFTGETESGELAQQYADVLSGFENITSLRLSTSNNGKINKLLTIMMKDGKHNWFKTVTTLKCYDVLGVEDPVVMQTFFTKFTQLETMKGIVTEHFNPLAGFQEQQIHIKNFYCNMPNTPDLRKVLITFLEHNHT